MKRCRKTFAAVVLCILGLSLLGSVAALAAQKQIDESKAFPRSLESYNDSELTSISAILVHRAKLEPFNLVASLIFLCAIIHTFLTGKFMAIAHKWEHEHEQKIKKKLVDKSSVHHGAELFHFLGEVEAVFGLWVIALAGAIFFSSTGPLW